LRLPGSTACHGGAKLSRNAAAGDRGVAGQ